MHPCATRSGSGLRTETKRGPKLNAGVPNIHLFRRTDPLWVRSNVPKFMFDTYDRTLVIRMEIIEIGWCFETVIAYVVYE